MHFYKRERLIVLIDGLHMRSVERALGIHIDFARMRSHFQAGAYLVGMIYYTPLAPQQGEDPLRRLVDWLAYNGYQVVTRPARHYVDHDGKNRLRGDTRVALAVDAMALAPAADHFVMIAGHSDFAHLAEALQIQGKRVSVLSSMQTLIADELRRTANQFIEIETLLPDFDMAASANDVGREAVAPDGNTHTHLAPGNESSSEATIVERRKRVPRLPRSSARTGRRSDKEDPSP
ncbi:MAG: NYN domain-containing protein [Hyphomicrobiaceae bacterium]|nr:NYN domain-containing protein [Hyphomicrobiaceae bacterium]